MWGNFYSFPMFWWGNWGREKLSNFEGFTESGRTGIQTRACAFYVLQQTVWMLCCSPPPWESQSSWTSEKVLVPGAPVTTWTRLLSFRDPNAIRTYACTTLGGWKESIDIGEQHLSLKAHTFVFAKVVPKTLRGLWLKWPTWIELKSTGKDPVETLEVSFLKRSWYVRKQI